MTDTLRAARILARPCAAAVALMLFAAPAYAQKAPSQAAAQALFEEGRRLMNAGKLSEACPKLAESQRLDPGAGTLLNLAACYEKNGQTASAWATYKEAISESEKSNRKEWAARARQHATALEPTLSKLVIAVPASSRVTGLVVKRDGAEVASAEWSLPIPVDPGGHVIEVSAPGRKPWVSTAQAPAKKETVTVTVPQLELAPVAEAPAPTPTPIAPTPAAAPAPGKSEAASATPPPGSSTQRTVGFVVGGVGVAGLAVGAIFGLQAMSAKKDAEGNPGCNPDLTVCNQSGLDAVDEAKSRATISTIGFIAGGALAAAGVVLVLTAPKSSPTPSTTGRRSHSPAVSLRVGGVGSGTGVTFGANL